MEHKTNRQLQADKTRESIILAVLKLLDTKDIHELTIREIAKTAGVSTGSFYVYFPSKEAALLYVYRRLDETFTGLALGSDAAANLRALLSSYLQLAQQDTLPLLRKVYIAHLLYYDEYFFSEQRPIFQLIRTQLEALHPGRDAGRLTWKLLDYCRGCLYNLCIRREPGDLDAWRAEVLEDLMAMVQ